jgi:PAS domain S-box-containing protein
MPISQASSRRAGARTTQGQSGLNDYPTKNTTDSPPAAPRMVALPPAEPGSRRPDERRASSQDPRLDQNRPPLSPDDLAVFLSLSTELFAVIDVERGLVWSNGAAAALLGYDDDELLGKSLVDLIHPDDLAEVRHVFTRSSGEPHGVRTRYRCKGGGWRWLEWTARADPGTGLIYGAARDVTARYAAQGALAVNEARLQAILDHSSAVIYVKDRAGRFVLVNESFLETFGFERADVLGRTAPGIWPHTPLDDADRRVLERGDVFTRDDVVELADGSHVMMTVRFPLLDAEDHIAGMAAIGTDVTDWAHVESALAERQRLLDTVIRACPDIVAVLDRHGRVREVSDASVRILGFDLSDPVHEEIEALVHPDDLPVLHAEYAKVRLDRDSRLDVRYRVRHADGQWIVLDTRGQVIVGEDGRTAGAVIVSRDITDELEIEAQMRAALEIAEKASTAKSEFLSRMSHELRTPLNSVLGFSQLLDMDGLPDQQGEAVGHIMRAGRHLLNLIDEVLDIARIESGNLELLLEPVAIDDVLRDAVDLVSPLAERRSIDVVANPGPYGARCYVRADRKRLLQVLLNLLSNAVKYNRVGGRVAVSVERRAEEVVRITVTDTGNGIGAEDIARVFEPFDRLGAENSGVEGTGVGLTLSKHLVERMGGSIELHSHVGEGTTFAVDLPSAVPAKMSNGAVNGGSEDTPDVATLRVLHVEDNLANLELVDQALTRSGPVTLMAAMSGSLGLELAREHRPDLVLLDLHLPDIPGTTLLDELYADPRTADIPVVVVSADATPAQIERLRDRGVAAYLTKPIDVRELLRVVDDVSDRRSALR